MAAASSASWSDRRRGARPARDNLPDNTPVARLMPSRSFAFIRSPAMTGPARSPSPTELTLHQQSRVLEVAFDDGSRFRLPFELLRVCSPSAEVRGHGPGQEVLQTGKRAVEVVSIEPVGHYAIQPRFSDGHDSGIFSWDYLYELGRDQSALWQDYEARLAAAGMDRDAPMTTSAAGACSRH
jgi:DUF971 family protein